MSNLTHDTSPADLLACVRGPVTNARMTYPERIRVEVTDVGGDPWRLATWDVDYSPSDPEALIGRTVVDTSLDDLSGILILSFSDGTRFTVTPTPAGGGDVEYWELFTPEALVLSYGPIGQWQLGTSDETPRALLLGVPESSPEPVRDSRKWKQACRELELDDDERELASRDLHTFQFAEGEGR